MGNFGSSQLKSNYLDHGAVEQNKEKNHSGGGGGMLFFLHRTWAVILTSKSRSPLTRKTETSDIESELTSRYSQYSFCSCSQCQRLDDGELSSGCYSDFFDSASCNMPPNTEDVPKMENQFLCMEEIANKDKQRPPVYNPEDYAVMLKKWGKKSANGAGIMSLYANSTASDTKTTKSQPISFRDYRNPMLTSSDSEMSLKQFTSVSELLTKLKSDLRQAFPSFVQEFVSDPLDGITLLLDLLRAIQLSQSNTVIHGPSGTANTVGKIPPSLQRRALLDELSCLQCLLNCCLRYQEAVRRMIGSSAGLFTVAVCIMSNVNKSRIVALQLLNKACDPLINGHTAVSEALSTLRLRFGEPVRFRFLVGMLTSTGGNKDLVASGLRFLNKFLDTARSTQQRVYIQAELFQAGLDMGSLKKNLESTNGNELVMQEIKYWEKKHVDIENLTARLEVYKKENQVLKDRVNMLERRIKGLTEETNNLSFSERNLREKCGELQLEIRSLKSDQESKISFPKKDDLTPNEDEGISSSERSFSPENDIHPESIYEVYPAQRQQPASNNQIDDINNSETETTIDDVIEELNNIINDEETAEYARNNIKKSQKEIEQKKIQEAQVAGKLQPQVDLDDYALNAENEIIPQNLQPHPPRKTKSLVHLYVPSEDYYQCSKELFFENETPYTSDTSDSLLSISKFNKINSVNRKLSDVKNKTCSRRNSRSSSNFKYDVNRSDSWKHLKMAKKNLVDGCYYYSTSINVCSDKNCKDYQEVTDNWIKSKSLDRIDSGLDSLVDIVVTDHHFNKKGKTKSDSGNVTDRSFTKSISNIYIQKDLRPKFGSFSSEDKQTMFLPAGDAEIPYFFPRIQEKRLSSINSTSFLIKRGHTNAGMYSGQVENPNKSFGKNIKEIVPLSCGKTVNGKFTDMPSGLY